MRKMTNTEFIDHNGDSCPWCRSDEIGSKIDETAILELDRVCLACDKEWTEKHAIISYTEIIKETT